MRVILITGASSGIGAATARALAAPDTAIALHARKNRAGAGEGRWLRPRRRRRAAGPRRRSRRKRHRAGPGRRDSAEIRPARRRGEQCRLRRPPPDRRTRSRRLGRQPRGHDLGLLRARDSGQAVAGESGRLRPTDRRVVVRGPCLRARAAELPGVGRGQGRHGGAGARFCRRDRTFGRDGQLRGARPDREGSPRRMSRFRATAWRR